LGDKGWRVRPLSVAHALLTWIKAVGDAPPFA
jgi:hypothetical protein